MLVGSFALLFEEPDSDIIGKPVKHFSSKEFEKAYPSEVDAPLH